MNDQLCVSSFGFPSDTDSDTAYPCAAHTAQCADIAESTWNTDAQFSCYTNSHSASPRATDFTKRPYTSESTRDTDIKLPGNTDSDSTDTGFAHITECACAVLPAGLRK
ncbi:MAG: hypothetical protein ACYS21_18060 [Planctomycetota bacterium]|jgi:hypothetical protein